jgi:glycosyltransferase involved in cell wall biosynthesis
MISMIVATRNRAHTLALVAPSFFEQELVSEIIFVDDCGEDNTAEVVSAIAKEYPSIDCKIIRNEPRKGQGQSRNVGIAAATKDYVLFCDDDEYMEKGYAKTCLEKLQQYNAGVVSGRRVYMRMGETREQALERFGNGLSALPPYYKVICEYANSAIFEGDLKLPLVNSIMLTRKETLEKFPFDPYYFKGNGYREESDFQMNLFVHGFDNIMTNDAHTVHLPLEQVKTGGQRVNLFRRVFWSIFYTNYFFGKYYSAYARRMGFYVPRYVAVFAFAAFAFYKEFIRPGLRDLLVSMGVEKIFKRRPEVLPAETA